MKINIIQTLASVLIAGIVALVFWKFGFSLLVVLMTGGMLLLSLVAAMGLEFGNAGREANIKVVSWIAFVVFAVFGLLSGLFDFDTVTVVVGNLLMLVLMLLLISNLYHAKM